MSGYKPEAPWQFDEVVIDEGQDFQPAWRDAMLKLLLPNGRAWWLEDPMQNLYGRPPVELPGWVVLRAQTNYRTPRDILGYLQRLVAPNNQSSAAARSMARRSRSSSTPATPT